jgi:hypothetical protein
VPRNARAGGGATGAPRLAAQQSGAGNRPLAQAASATAAVRTPRVTKRTVVSTT